MEKTVSCNRLGGWGFLRHVLAWWRPSCWNVAALVKKILTFVQSVQETFSKLYEHYTWPPLHTCWKREIYEVFSLYLLKQQNKAFTFSEQLTNKSMTPWWTHLKHRTAQNGSDNGLWLLKMWRTFSCFIYNKEIDWCGLGECYITWSKVKKKKKRWFCMMYIKVWASPGATLEKLVPLLLCYFLWSLSYVLLCKIAKKQKEKDVHKWYVFELLVLKSGLKYRIWLWTSHR